MTHMRWIHAPPVAGFVMTDALAEYEVSQTNKAVEQQVILKPIQLELKVEANRRFLREAPTEHDKLFMNVDEAAYEQNATPSGAVVVYISDEE
ncbi:hypothetical protein D1007_36370 [Hordeum vulgare]|nr:hypothetical protein D1007_36370 [Hordeum vulgare]